MNRIQFRFYENMFLKVKKFRILLEQEDQLLIGINQDSSSIQWPRSFHSPNKSCIVKSYK